MAEQTHIQDFLGACETESQHSLILDTPTDPFSSQSNLPINIESSQETDSDSDIDDCDENDDDSDDISSICTLSPNKLYAIWRLKKHKQWVAWWSKKAENHPNRGKFNRIRWDKPRRSTTWKMFYHAVEISTLLPKAICKECWKSYAHPELGSGGSGGSSTSTLERHCKACKSSKSQQKLTQSTLVVQVGFSLTVTVNSNS